jgi:hypothetical protein
MNNAMQYSVDITIDENDLDKIYGANQSVTFVKSVNQFVGANVSSYDDYCCPVAWLAFQPLESNNVSWIENYYMYASTTVLQSGAAIKMNSQTTSAVQIGWLYTFASGMFTGASSGGEEPDAFNLYNGMTTPQFNFGLAQHASVNNIQVFAPLNAVPVLYNQDAIFTPMETVSIFLSSCSANGTVIPIIPSNALTFTLTPQNPSANVGFNDNNNEFYII